MDGKAYGSQNFQDFMGDSSNHCKDTAIGAPEQFKVDSLEAALKGILIKEKEKSIVSKWMDYMGWGEK